MYYVRSYKYDLYFEIKLFKIRFKNLFIFFEDKNIKEKFNKNKIRKILRKFVVKNRDY